ncbi:hypothetical protein MYX84_16120, partial [Acidobacteria bacterium AH-259-O06]|nr:hypothetical protein [Acidobacteria bacterium AH-259-O06]
IPYGHLHIAIAEALDDNPDTRSDLRLKEWETDVKAYNLTFLDALRHPRLAGRVKKLFSTVGSALSELP